MYCKIHEKRKKISLDVVYEHIFRFWPITPILFNQKFFDLTNFVKKCPSQIQFRVFWVISWLFKDWFDNWWCWVFWLKSLIFLFHRRGSLFKYSLFRGGRFSAFPLQVHSRRLLVGRGHHDHGRIWWHDVCVWTPSSGEASMAKWSYNSSKDFYLIRSFLKLESPSKTGFKTSKMTL